MQLLLSTLLLWRECRISPSTRVTTEWKSVRLYVIPSIIYLIHNNVQFATLTYVDTSTYQIMGNLKIVTTAILFRCLVCTMIMKLCPLILNFPSYMSFSMNLASLQLIHWPPPPFSKLHSLGYSWGGDSLICSGWQLFY